MKLICISSYSYNFSKIARGEKAKFAGYDGAVYVDLFAGPGLVTIEETGDRVAGSPIASTTGQRFDFSIFVERRKRFKIVLEKRVGTYLDKDKFLVIEGDCNEKIKRVVSAIEDRFHKPIVLVFVDPEGMEAKFETLRTLSTKFSSIDFMINVTSGVERVRQTILSGAGENMPIFSDYFGDQAMKILLEMDESVELQERYASLIRDVLGRRVGAVITICAHGNKVLYYILAFTRPTLSGSPWAKILEHIRLMLKGVDGELARQTLDIVKHRLGTLNSDFSKEAAGTDDANEDRGQGKNDIAI